METIYAFNLLIPNINRRIVMFSLVFWCVPTGANVNFCYNGNNDKALKNQSCLTGALHIVNSDIADSRDRLSTTLSFSEIDSQQIDTLSDGMEKESQVKMCAVFRYDMNLQLSPEVTSLTTNFNFTCDFNKWCADKGLGVTSHMVTLNGQRGNLYCCETNNCNLASVVQLMPPPQLCYKQDQDLDPDSGAEILCNNLDAWCIRTHLLNSSNKKTTYDCDNEQLCQQFNMTSGPSFVCRNVTLKQGITELCCCSRGNCFNPSYTFPSDAFNIFSNEEVNGVNGTTIGLIIAFSLLATIGAGVMIGLMYQRRDQPSSSLTLTYSRIEDDDVSDNSQML